MAQAQPARHESVAASVSNALVHLHKEFYGKGPVKAKTYFVDDTVLCMLAGGFTTFERTLIEQGNADQVETMRRAFQRAMEDKFRGAIEEIVGCAVIAYISQVNVDPDLAVELFVLEPRGETVTDEHESSFEDTSPD